MHCTRDRATEASRPTGRKHERQMRHRRTAQRRKVDAVQCAHRGGHRRRRTTRSARSSRTSASSTVPGSAARRARRDRQAAEGDLPATVEFVDIAGLVAGASKGEGLGNQFLATHPRDRRHRPRRALLRGPERHPRRAAASTRSPTSRRSTPSWRSRTSTRSTSRSVQASRSSRATAGDKDATAHPRRARTGPRSARTQAKPAPHASSSYDEERALLQAVFPADDEADALRRERRRAVVSSRRNPTLAAARARTREPRRPPVVVDLRGDRGARSPSSTPRTAHLPRRAWG